MHFYEHEISRKGCSSYLSLHNKTAPSLVAKRMTNLGTCLAVQQLRPHAFSEGYLVQFLVRELRSHIKKKKKKKKNDHFNMLMILWARNLGCLSILVHIPQCLV